MLIHYFSFESKLIFYAFCCLCTCMYFWKNLFFCRNVDYCSILKIRFCLLLIIFVLIIDFGIQIKEESGVTIKRESGADEEVETIEVGEGEGNKNTPDSLTLTSPTLKKEKDIKREKDIKKESVKTEHRDPAHRTKDAKMAESELVRDLKAQLKYVHEDIQRFQIK